MEESQQRYQKVKEIEEYFEKSHENTKYFLNILENKDLKWLNFGGFNFQLCDENFLEDNDDKRTVNFSFNEEGVKVIFEDFRQVLITRKVGESKKYSSEEIKNTNILKEKLEEAREFLGY